LEISEHITALAAEGSRLLGAAGSAALSAAPPDLRCWTFLPAPSPLAMWARRQAHETTVHRVDAELAAASVAPPAATVPVLPPPAAVPVLPPAGAASVVPPPATVPVLPPAGVSVLLPPAGLAADGVDELLGAFLPRPGRATGRAGEAPARILVRCTDVEAGWLVTVNPDGVTTEPARSAPEAGAVVAAPAAELYLALWRRAGADGLALQGDRTLLDRLLERTRVLWS